MTRNKSNRRHSSPAAASEGVADQQLRIIGGRFRGSKLRYHGDPSVRPMKHRVREAIFNLLSTACKGCHAIDLFAGTGALGLEAISRGAKRATLIEQHVPTARIVAQNIAHLGLQEQCALSVTSAFLWGKRDLPGLEAELPRIVFCSPPYAFFIERQAELLELIFQTIQYAPAESLIVLLCIFTSGGGK
jgi:16S rRNA (guanine966-N2)-methyltransferase